MSRPDWGALQQEYIAEYTRSGISPVAWCEARGLNYATARRYIKKTPKNAQTEMCKTAQKSAQKKSAQTAQKRNEKSQEKKPVFDAGLNEGDAEEFSFCPDEFGISDQQAKFAMLVAQGKKPTEAYRLAGYEGQGATANSNASRMLKCQGFSRYQLLPQSVPETLYRRPGFTSESVDGYCPGRPQSACTISPC
ncbi:hypothetical protein HmCmsJML284_01074 [Escherichia coli]|nr:hypothetical protein HmCmsJML284_01074 [Escherichia coli]